MAWHDVGTVSNDVRTTGVSASFGLSTAYLWRLCVTGSRTAPAFYLMGRLSSPYSCFFGYARQLIPVWSDIAKQPRSLSEK